MNDPLHVTNSREVRIDICDSLNGAAFLVCGGPSLKEIPYQRLAERGIYSLAVNNSAGLVPCKAFVFSDPPQKFHSGIFLDPCVTVFAPLPKLKKHIRFKMMDGTFTESTRRVRECPNVLGFKRCSEFIPENFLTSEMASWGTNKAAAKRTGREKTVSTMLLGLRLLHYLGFRRVYMIGVDLTMTPDDTKAIQYAFPQKKESGGVLANLGSYRVINQMLVDLRPVFDAAGYHVFNCNPKSGCSAFDYVPFEHALQDCRGLVPEGEFDLAGWYEKDPKKKRISRREKRRLAKLKTREEETSGGNENT